MKKTAAPIRLLPYRIAFGFLAVYFFLMGAFLIVFPGLLLRNLGAAPNQTVIGMLRGAGGATLPYALLYVLIAAKPIERRWANSVILCANALAIGVDCLSLVLSEYTTMQAMMDLPVEVFSLLVILLFRHRIPVPASKPEG